MMKMVIDLSKETYKRFIDDFTGTTEILQAVRHGTPLPKQHGRLIDADALIQELSVVSSRPIKSQLYILNEAPTIIEADKESESK